MRCRNRAVFAFDAVLFSRCEAPVIDTALALAAFVVVGAAVLVSGCVFL